MGECCPLSVAERRLRHGCCGWSGGARRGTVRDRGQGWGGCGTVTATTPAGITYCGSTENGTLTLTGDAGGVHLDRSQVNGLAYVESNSGPAVTVAGNTVTGSLYCTGNTPAPGDNNKIKTVSGTATGQCAPLAVR